jgi:YD repeat-containing protein
MTQSNMPPYLEVIYGQRNDPAASTSLGSEEEVSSGSEEGITYTYLYNGDGNMIAETIGLTTTVYIGNIYEKKDQGGTITQKKYYYAGSLRVAVSTKEGAGSWEVNFLLSDHLGSTSLTVDADGDGLSRIPGGEGYSKPVWIGGRMNGTKGLNYGENIPTCR